MIHCARWLGGDKAELGGLLALFEQFSVSMKVNKVNISGPVVWVHGIETSHRLKKSGEVSSSQNFGTNIL
jgi:hypothetical protein